MLIMWMTYNCTPIFYILYLIFINVINKLDYYYHLLTIPKFSLATILPPVISPLDIKVLLKVVVQFVVTKP